MNLIPRVSLIIYLKHIKHERQIRKYGHIVHSNKQRNMSSCMLTKRMLIALFIN